MKTWVDLLFSCAVAVLLCACARTALAQAPETPEPPAEFTRFEFAGHEEQAELLSRFLWYHFYHRLGNGPTLFNKEYLLVADAWLDGAIPRGTDQTIQATHRGHLLAIEMDADGYVDTHQHFSHAHDRGWPFPMWTLSGNGPEGVRGLTFGWHFQPLERVPGWVGDTLRHWQDATYCGDNAVRAWELHELQSEGIVDNTWRLVSAGPAATLTSPAGFPLDAFNAPFLQLRWSRSGTPPFLATPYIEWLRDGDTSFGEDRRVYFYPERTPLSGEGRFHSILAMHEHPLWDGRISRVRIAPAPGETGVTLDIDSFFTAYDTRHTINNPIFVIASACYFGWTGDLDFLRRNVGRMRTALRYQQTVMGGIEHSLIRNPWPGHDGLPGWTKDAEGKLTLHPGHGIGNNYWDILPFGGEDFYATYQYYAATLRLAELEEAIRNNPGWGIPAGADAMDPAFLRQHAAEVRAKANAVFWNPGTNRFAACVDAEGNRYDFGFTFLNLDAIWYDLATEEHAAAIMDWLSGRRVVPGDTSTGDDIYHWRFGPRATTRRNLEWYGQGWTAPESIPWGGQVQDGGAVLGFTFYDLWARLRVLGPDDAWQRLAAILAWEKEVRAAGGYRAFYADGKQGATLQGGGTAGGIGVDCEFYESSLLPAIIVYGFAGLRPGPDALEVRPRMPQALPELTVRRLRYRGVPMDLTVRPGSVTITVHERPVVPLRIRFLESCRLDRTGKTGTAFVLDDPGLWLFSFINN
ncbi:MAG: hypothetical protein KA184_03080 [Candidatus Hydrogenedentes bacterium]|nr:hypothetical protein [Candidatus Hydrogenedentota bacterium]